MYDLKREPLKFNRWGKTVKQRFCANKKCKSNQKKDQFDRPNRFYKFGMMEIGCRDRENHYCHLCGGHYEGERGNKKLKFIPKEEWEQAIEKAWKEI